VSGLRFRIEAFGMVLLQAGAMVTPVIGARAGAIPAVVDHERDGLLVPFGDVAALADAIRSLTADPTLAARLAAAGRNKVVDEAAWYQRIRGVYAQVLGTPADPVAAVSGEGR